MDLDTKLVPCWYVETRDGGAAYHFMLNVEQQLATRVQLTTDGHKAYLNAVEKTFGTEIDYAQLVKIYGNPLMGTKDNSDIRYSPAICMDAKKAVITCHPDYKYVSTNHVERQDLTMRMSMRRFTRLTNAHLKKVENHMAAISLHYMYYNFARTHQTLRCTPAMEAGVSKHDWIIAEIVRLLP